MTVRSRRTIRTLAAAGAVVVLAATATACGADASDDKHPDHRSFALEGRTLTVDSDDSSLELVPADGDSDRVKVTRWFEGSTVIGSDPKPTWSWDAGAGRLTLRLHCGGVVTDCSARHRVEVPRGVALVVDNGDGSVRASGFESGLDITTRDGSVRVTDTSGPLRLRGQDASLRASGVDARRVSVDTQDGSADIALRTAPDRVAARSEDGALTLTLPGTAQYKVTTGTDDGAVDVSVPTDPRSAHQVTAHAQDGKVTLRTAN
ncbi:DUF4097 family beta strand repeat protein [Streptomyces sp. SID8379]|uniref:DUF4097 family beta strand repeat-containing protein n=1 Tax=unclassified Streptomyces TaxID=2593676 RepID=UPI00037CA7D2|nr:MULTISPECIES: DUF4097 family beta strand repeat-containing protein [unclassified Streptomyces]MYW65431.1 DUF4097 family beta strand repeat protein [Streptomyces sp. SID8379]